MAQTQLKTQEILRSPQDNAGGVTASSPSEVEESLRLIEDLKFFLATAPANWQENQIIRRYYLNNDQGFVSCVFWNNLYYVTGTDIVKCCVYRMQKFGRQVVDRKKFEEGIFSDLRNLKCGVDATLELPRSEFLSFLFKNMCLKTQKKQKVFFWFSVPHNKLFADALERDLKRQLAGQVPTTKPASEPALSFTYDDNSGLTLYEQLSEHMSGKLGVSRPGSHAATEVAVEAATLSSKSIPVAAAAAGYGYPVKNLKPEVHSIKKEESAAALQFDPDDEVAAIPTRDALPINSSPDGTSPMAQHLRLDSASQAPPSLLDDPPPAEDDFPLDYFPVEVEYPQDPLPSGNDPLGYGDEFDDRYAQMAPGPSATTDFYENQLFLEEAAIFTPVVASAARYAFHVPAPPPPMSAARSHFMTNGEFYASYMKGNNRGKGTGPDITHDRSDDDPADDQEVVDSSKPGPDPRPPVQGWHPYGNHFTGRYPYSIAEAQFGGSDPYLTRSYTMDDYLCDNPSLYAPDAFTTAPFSPMHSQMGARPFTPGLRIAAMPPTTQYVPVSSYPGKPVMSASTKTHPMNPYYQPSSHFQRWGNVHGHLKGFPSIQATSAPQGTSMQNHHHASNSVSRPHFGRQNKVSKRPVALQKKSQRNRFQKLFNRDPNTLDVVSRDYSDDLEPKELNGSLAGSPDTEINN